MSRMKHVGVTILYFCVWVGSLPAQTGVRNSSPRAASVVSAGGYQLTEQMLDQALRFGQILAAADFSSADASALRADLIAYFQKEPVKQMAAYESVAKILQQGIRPTVSPPGWNLPWFATGSGSRTATRSGFASSRATLLAGWF